MGTGKGGKYQIPGIRGTVAHMHSRQSFISFPDARHIRKIKQRINPVGKHIHGNRYNIHISGTFPVSKQRTLNPVCPGKDSKLCIADAAAPVIMRMKA